MSTVIPSTTRTHVQVLCVHCADVIDYDCCDFRLGGIIPTVARDLHQQQIKGVVEQAVLRSGVTYSVS